MRKTKNVSIGQSRKRVEKQANRLGRYTRSLQKDFLKYLQELDASIEQDKQESISQLCHALRQYPCRIQGCLNAYYLETDQEKRDQWLFLAAQSNYEMLAKIDTLVADLQTI